MSSNNPDAPRKQDIAYRLYLAGATYQEIADSKDPETGKPLYAYSSGAFTAVKAARKRYAATGEDPEIDPEIDEDLAIEVSRLDRLQRALWPAATAGDVSAVREIRQLVMARAKLRMGTAIEAKPAKEDVLDELANRRAARRTAATD